MPLWLFLGYVFVFCAVWAAGCYPKHMLTILLILLLLVLVIPAVVVSKAFFILVAIVLIALFVSAVHGPYGGGL